MWFIFKIQHFGKPLFSIFNTSILVTTVFQLGVYLQTEFLVSPLLFGVTFMTFLNILFSDSFLSTDKSSSKSLDFR